MPFSLFVLGIVLGMRAGQIRCVCQVAAVGSRRRSRRLHCADLVVSASDGISERTARRRAKVRHNTESGAVSTPKPELKIDPPPSPKPANGRPRAARALAVRASGRLGHHGRLKRPLTGFLLGPATLELPIPF
jgi:hypothetical protein